MEIVNKTTLNSIIKKNLLTTVFAILYFILKSYGTVQYTKSRIPKRNNIFIYLLFHILLDPDQEQLFRIQAKVQDPCGSGSRSTTLKKCTYLVLSLTVGRVNKYYLVFIIHKISTVHSEKWTSLNLSFFKLSRSRPKKVGSC